MIKSEKLFFDYSQDTNVLSDINFEINQGEFVAILGANGSGKSTLARHINALLIPKSGTMLVKGLDTRLPENTWQIRQTAGMVFQNPENQIIATLVEEDVAFGLENIGVPHSDIRPRVDMALKTVGMYDYRESQPHNLSGGQKQRVAIAGILAMKPDCIVFDEPTAMLDPRGRKEVIDTILKLNKEGITIILITHFMEEAIRAGRVIVMNDSRIIMDDVPQNIFTQIEKMKSLGLGVPQITEFAFLLKQKGFNISEKIFTIDDFLNENINISFNYKPCTIPTNKTDTIIEIKNLTHIYSPDSVFETCALNNINLKIFKGEMIGIIGHTGSGKSTLIQHMNVLMEPTSGQIFLNGEDINADKKRLKSIRQKVGLVFQYPEHQLFETTVYKDVAFGPTRMELSPEEIHENTINALTSVGLDETVYEKSPFELSGGQKRRAAIAGVLAMRPEVLILDEPTAGLDPRGRKEILDQIKHMHENLGLTVILVSHSMDDAARLCERIFVLNKGQIEKEGTPSEVFADPVGLYNIGLDIPEISKLMNILNKNLTGIFTAKDAVNIII